MKKIILATKNAGKVREFAHLLGQHQVEVLSLLEIGYEAEIEETGTTFEENALIKAQAVAGQLATKERMIIVADDSGLEVDALGGAPGVYSARYAGAMRDDQANMDKVLQALKAVEDAKRSARFVCALAMIDELGNQRVVRGTCEGQILRTKRGTNGFGYDQIFYLPKQKKTMAQLAKAEKNVLSHRQQAMNKLNLVKYL